jgi:hypothetical protein
MATLDQIIQREINPFDPVTFYTGSFWEESQTANLTVDSIHQTEIAEITQILAEVDRDHQSRSILLLGDIGSGKSYLLSRLKQQLNSKAFFAYIGPWVENGQIWRHILRYTVDSLMHKPDGEEESQLLLWLKGLSAFDDRGLKKKVMGERRLFIHNLRGTYPSGLYQPNEFFGVLYDLTNPELYYTACDWLRGDDLDEDSLKAIRVKRSIETETDAKNLLSNFGKISTHTQPIVLCFDQIDSTNKTSNIDIYKSIPALFTVNTTIHNECLKNFFIIISLINNNWKNHHHQILQADKDRIYKGVVIKQITCDQAEAIWEKRLYPLHQQASVKPESSIYPLTRQALEAKFPGGKTFPRYALKLAQQLYQDYKLNIKLEPDPTSDSKSSTDKVKQGKQGKQNKQAKQAKQKNKRSHPSKSGAKKVSQVSNPIAAFRLLWEHQLKKTQEKITRIRYFSNPELIQMLREALEALEVPEIQPRLLPSQKYDSSSISCQLPKIPGKTGFAWTEDGNFTNFYYFMSACQKTIHHNLCQKLYLIRSGGLGSGSNKGYKLYKQIFSNSQHCHVIPSLESVQYLATYHNLVNAAAAGELVVGDRTPDIPELQELMRQSSLLQDCTLLQELGILPSKKSSKPKDTTQEPNQKATQFIISLVETQQMLGRDTLMKNTLNFEPRLDEEKFTQLLEQLIQEQKIQIIGPDNNPDAQFVCLLPQ